MPSANKSYCPLSEEFFYWPPEEIAQYDDWCEIRNWCETGNLQHKRRLKKITKVIKITNLMSDNKCFKI